MEGNACRQDSGLVWCLVAFTKATLVVLCGGENGSRRSV